MNWQVTLIKKLDTEGKRDIQGAAISAALVIGLGYLGLYLFELGDWWWRVLAGGVVFVALVGMSSMFEDLQRVPRDAKNKKLT